MNILAVEPFFSGSHKAFLTGLQAHSQHRVQCITQSLKGQKWRLQPHATALAAQANHISDSIDLLLVSSMLNLPAFLALTRSRFSAVPIVVLMHENPLTQPIPEGQQRDATHVYHQFLSTLSADRLMFNSTFHRGDFLNSLPAFLDQFGDANYEPQLKQLADKSIIMPPGLDLQRFDAHPDTRSQNERPVIVWNQRWQFDRNPAMFFRVLNRLNDIDLEFELILAGDSTHAKPPEFEKARQRFGQNITHFGFVDDFENYSQLLHRGDVVISTATYEFFCVAIMEAIYCGCHPLLPKRLHYPELIPETLYKPLLHAPVLYETEDDLFHYLKDLLTGESKPLPKASLQNINKHLDWEKRITAFDNFFDEVIAE